MDHSQFSTASPDIDEKAIRDPDPRKMCAEISRAKARALVQSLDKPGILITADQVPLCASISLQVVIVLLYLSSCGGATVAYLGILHGISQRNSER